MPLEQLSHFDEKSGIIPCSTAWGCWWQTVEDVNVEVNLPEKTRSRDVKVNVAPRTIECVIHGKIVFKGNLFSTVHSDDVVWTIEDGNLLRIVLSKADHSTSEQMWESLLEGDCHADMLTLHEMRKKLDLERFQIENPGFDFSGAKLSKCYDKLPGSSQVPRPEEGKES